MYEAVNIAEVANALDSHAKGRRWSPVELETIKQGIEDAHRGGITGPSKVAALIYAGGFLPGRSLYSIFWQVRKDRHNTV